MLFASRFPRGLVEVLAYHTSASGENYFMFVSLLLKR